MFILFLDTKKAFDSIHHDFIHCTLAKIGMPLWVILAIRGLMFNVKVKWVGDFAGPYIKIERGVKQGCPLSPLLFAICYDVLLRRLIAKPTVSPYAFADDLAASASSIGDIIWTLRTLIEFSRFSGLGLNIDKTSILTTLPPSARIINIMQIFGFRDIRFVTRAKYLGVWMGSDITTYDIFEGAKNKFVDRVHNLAQILKPQHFLFDDGSRINPKQTPCPSG